ncbi:MAG TPA: CRTAC1 family protein [Candidatus Cybelea sp.]|nr:CRTAC1 family protein [Candidatus Cybelea sp.]
MASRTEKTDLHLKRAAQATVATAFLFMCLGYFFPAPRAEGIGFDPPNSTSPLQVSSKGQPAGGLLQLVDITNSTGIRFNHLSSPEQKYVVESMSGGVALIDYDRDGWPDIYLTNAQNVEMALGGKKARGALYHNNHDGTFTDVTGKAGVGEPCWAMGAVVGDYNNDGWPDLLVTCFGGVVLYRNNGDGTFTDVTRQAGLGNDSGWATGASFGDYDGDGWDDLFVSHYVDFRLDTLPTFGSSPTCKYRGIDVQCGPRGLKGSPASLYHNSGQGVFEDVSKPAGIRDSPDSFGLTAVWSHFDEGGNLDLFLANDAGRNYLFQNDGNGHFSEIGFSAGVAASQDGADQANMGVAIGDYLHTGEPSIAVTHFSDEYTALYRNDGKMNFTDASFTSLIAPSTTPYVGWGDAFVDLSNTGWLDLLLVNGHVYPQVDSGEAGPRYREPALLFANERDGTFKDISKLVGPAIQAPRVSRGLAVGDLFNDGHMEMVIENLEGMPTILRPEGGPPNHWISLQLEGTKSNRLALNARVRATAGNLVETSEVLSGGSYLSQNDLRLHFGLGGSTRVDKVEILWPSGGTDTLRNLAADRFYYIKEGEGIIPADKIRLSTSKR